MIATGYKNVWKAASTIKSVLCNRFASPTSFVTNVDFITCIRILKVNRFPIQTLNFNYSLSRNIRHYDKEWIFCPSIGCFGKHYSTQSSKSIHSKLNKKQLITEKFYEKKQKFKESSQVLLKDIKETKDKVKEKVEEVIEKENVVTIPNILCVLRIALSPYLGYLILDSHFSVAVGIFAFAGFTDLIDGWIARSFPSQSSKLGSFLDPMADKVLVATLFLTLTYMEQVPITLTCLIVIRDMLLVTAGFYIRYRSLPPPRTLSRYFDVTHATAQLAPTLISKINTAVQLSLAATTLAAPVFNYVDHPALHILWYITAGTTVASAISYIVSHNTYRFLKSNSRT